jgi:hypothetical protein
MPTKKQLHKIWKTQLQLFGEHSVPPQAYGSAIEGNGLTHIRYTDKPSVENNNIEFSSKIIGSVEYEGVDLDVISYWDAPVANIKFSYKFGNQFMKRKERLGGSGNEVLNRANE